MCPHVITVIFIRKLVTVGPSSSTINHSKGACEVHHFIGWKRTRISHVTRCFNQSAGALYSLCRHLILSSIPDQRLYGSLEVHHNLTESFVKIENTVIRSNSRGYWGGGRRKSRRRRAACCVSEWSVRGWPWTDPHNACKTFLGHSLKWAPHSTSLASVNDKVFGQNPTSNLVDWHKVDYGPLADHWARWRHLLGVFSKEKTPQIEVSLAGG